MRSDEEREDDECRDSSRGLAVKVKRERKVAGGYLGTKVGSPRVEKVYGNGPVEKGDEPERRGDN